MQSEVVTEGILELGKKPASTSRKDWKPRLFVLKWYPNTGRSTLDYYKDTKKRWQKQDAVGVASLWPAFEVSLAHACPYKYTIQLQTAETLLYLACDTEDEMIQWMNHIQMQRKLDPLKPEQYVYPVRIHDNKNTHQMGVKEDCFLAVTTQKELLCALPSSRQVVGVWPLGTLRRYWCEDGVFGFEAGRHSPRGEGTYLFSTSQDAEIYKVLQHLITQGELKARPPAPLPVAKPGDSPLLQAGAGPRKSEYEDDKKYDIVSQVAPLLPPKPLLKSQSDMSLHAVRPAPTDTALHLTTPTNTDATLSISPVYSAATPPISNPPSSSIVTNVLYGSRPMPPPAHDQGTPNTLKRRWLHDSIAPKVETGEPIKNLPPHTGLSSSSISKWIQNTQMLASDNVPQGIPPPDSTYAHTVHKMPVEFEVVEGPGTMLGPTLYNTLVHKGAPAHHPHEEVPPSLRDQQRLYDIAFTQSGSNSRPHSKNDYSVAYLPQEQVDGATSQVGAAPVPSQVAYGEEMGGETAKCTVSPALPPDIKLGQDDGLTANPLYGSKDTVIKEVMSLKISTPELNKRLRVLVAGEQAGEEVSAKSVNPDGGMSNSKDPQGYHLEAMAGEEAIVPPLEGSVDAIQRDSKGYSKVNKEGKAGPNGAQDNEAPPPLPARQY